MLLVFPPFFSFFDDLLSPDEFSDELSTLLLNAFPAPCEDIPPIVDATVIVDTAVTDVNVEIRFVVIVIFCVV